MDSVLDDIEFLMSLKQETPNSNVRANPVAEGVQNNDTEQLAMSTYMTDFILDYINRSLKNEEEETQPSLTDGDNDEESVEALLERAETMIRENMQSNQANVPATSVAAVNNEWMQSLNGQEELDIDTILVTSGPNCANQIQESAHTSRQPVVVGNDELADIISVDTDSDDEVVFVNTLQQPTEVIDLSEHSPPDNTIQPMPNAYESRKRTHDSTVNYSHSPAAPVAKSPEKQFRHSCAVCLEDVKSPHSTICGHIYCGECIKNSIKIFKKCPTCNKKLKVSNVHPIYL